jgi:hypothetical protein
MGRNSGQKKTGHAARFGWEWGQGIMPQSNILFEMGPATLFMKAVRNCGSLLSRADHALFFSGFGLLLLRPELLTGGRLILLDHLVGDHVHQREVGQRCAGKAERCDEKNGLANHGKLL